LEKGERSPGCRLARRCEGLGIATDDDCHICPKIDARVI
jgi:hypothetical protein